MLFRSYWLAQFIGGALAGFVFLYIQGGAAKANAPA